MPRITVEMFAGRTADQKRAIARELTEGFARATGAKPETVDIVLRDVDKSDWAKAGVLVSDRE